MAINQPVDFDNAWKEALEEYFAEFMLFFFPDAYNDIVWEDGYEFLDNELQQITKDAKIGKRFADKLVKVWQKGNVETWVLVHLEIQSQVDTDFPKRMYVYNYRIFDHYDRRVASFAVLGDEQTGWRPSSFDYRLWGSEVNFKFPIVKLTDYREEWEMLEKSENPFATAAMAHLKTQETRNDSEKRKLWKFQLIRQLYERDYKRDDIIKLFRFIDWIMQLPEELENELWIEISKYEEDEKMPYITSVERIGIEKGFKKGIEQGIEQGRKQGRSEGLLAGIESMLEFRFGNEGLRLMSEISKIDDPGKLRVINAALRTVKNLDELRHIYQ